MNLFRCFLFVCAFIALFFVTSTIVRAESIDSYDTRVVINPDGTVHVTETIVYNFADQEKHGIFRDIPVTYDSGIGTRYKIRLSDITVTDVAGVVQPFTRSQSNGQEHLTIGDLDTLINGVHTYRIRYTVDRALSFLSDHTELYWNAVGSGWDVPVGQASATVVLPQPLPITDVRITCYAGVEGSTAACTNLQVGESPVQEIHVNQTGLQPHEGLTVVVGFPLSIIPHTHIDAFWQWVEDNWPVMIPIATFVISFLWWWTKGRDPKGRGTIIPEFDVPDQLMPAEVGTVIDAKTQPRDIAAELIYLASQGYYTITREEKKHALLPDEVDYVLTQEKEPDDALRPYQKELLTKLFAKGTANGIVRLSALRKTFYTEYQSVVGMLPKRLSELGYYTADPYQRKRPLGIFGLVLFFGGVGVAIVADNAVLAGSTILAGTIACVFAAVTSMRTPAGVLTKEHAEGLRLYLNVAEKDRLAFHNAPEKNPAHFEAMLPYAMAFGVEKAWAKQFEGIAIQPPTWYHGGAGQAFVLGSFVNDLGAFRSEVQSALARAPGKSSGFAGAAGRGFGGGGGGSW